MAEPKLSIVIPALNEEKILPALLKSIRAQSFSGYEIILADAGSTDKTLEIAGIYGCRITKGGLPGVGRNRGADVAHGEILLFLDADANLADSNFFQNVLGEFDRKKLGAATVLSEASSDKILDKLFYACWNFWIIISLYFIPCAGGWCIFSRKEFHDGIKGFDERIKVGEDANYVFRISKICKFGILKSGRVKISPRRFHAEGYIKIIFHSLGEAFYRVILGKEDYGNRFDYQFDIYKKKKDKK